jgi:hypothetical protein
MINRLPMYSTTSHGSQGHQHSILVLHALGMWSHCHHHQLRLDLGFKFAQALSAFPLQPVAQSVIHVPVPPH